MEKKNQASKQKCKKASRKEEKSRRKNGKSSWIIKFINLMDK